MKLKQEGVRVFYFTKYPPGSPEFDRLNAYATALSSILSRNKNESEILVSFKLHQTDVPIKYYIENLHEAVAIFGEGTYVLSDGDKNVEIDIPLDLQGNSLVWACEAAKTWLDPEENLSPGM